MPKVKLIITDVTSYDDYYSNEIIRAGLSDWEEVSDEDYKFLKDNQFRLNRVMDVPGSVHLVVQDDKPIAQRIKSLKKAIEDERLKIEREEAERLRKRLEAADKRKLKKAAKDAEERRRMFEVLKQEFDAGGENPDDR